MKEIYTSNSIYLYTYGLFSGYVIIRAAQAVRITVRPARVLDKIYIIY